MPTGVATVSALVLASQIGGWAGNGTPSNQAPSSAAPPSAGPPSAGPTATPPALIAGPHQEPTGSSSSITELPPYKVRSGRVLVRMSPAELARQQAREAERIARDGRPGSGPISFQVASFNVLASQHTVPGGPRSRQFPPAGRRTPMAGNLIKAHGADVIGLQELKADQLAGIQRVTGMSAWPGTSIEPDNSILWDPGMFEFVAGETFTIRFMNSDRPQTIVRLRHRGSGREMYFLNMHASAGGGQYAVSRRNGHHAAIAQVNRLKEAGLPIFLTGDMNDRAEFFCRVAPAAGLRAAIGGSTEGGCRPAGALAVDWVLATPEVDWSGYVEDRSTLARRISDHHYVSGTATLGAAD